MSFLQSKPWAKFQESLGRPFFEYSEDNIKAIVFKYPLPFGKSYLYIPHGPDLNTTQIFGGFKNPMARFINYLQALAQKEKAIYIKIEPTIDHVAQLFMENKFKVSKKEIQPRKTVIIDMNQTEEELLNMMHHKTRYNIKVAEKYGVKIKPSHDADFFWMLLKKTSRRDQFYTHEEKYYKKLLDSFTLEGEIETNLMLAWFENKPVAGAIILNDGRNAYYLHGASDYDYRKYMAPYMLHWDIIKSLKSKGLKSYDWWGIDTQNWPGVSRFKLGWGGRIVEYPGSFDLPISEFWYRVYQMTRKLRR